MCLLIAELKNQSEKHQQNRKIFLIINRNFQDFFEGKQKWFRKFKEF